MCCNIKSRDDVIEEYHLWTSCTLHRTHPQMGLRTKIFRAQVEAYCLVVFLHVFFEGGSGGVGGL